MLTLRFLAITSLLASALTFSANATSPEIPLPTIPAHLTQPAERAEFLVKNFWNALDFGSKEASGPEFMEQNFVNFINILPHAPREASREAIEILINQASAYPKAFSTLSSLADKYLYQLDSPMCNDVFYRDFIIAEIATGRLDEAETIRRKAILADLDKNSPGTKATDINLELADGTLSSLSNIAAGCETVILFFDPECDRCIHTIADMKSNPTLSQLIKDGKLQLVTICTSSERQSWDKYKHSLPAEWINAIDVDGMIEAEDLYILPEIPLIYTISADGNILTRNVLPHLFLDALR